MFLKPAEGRTVADPDRGDELPAGGRDVPLTQYWQRRIVDGDVIEGQPDADGDAVEGRPDTDTETQG